MPKWWKWAALAVFLIAVFRDPSGTALFVHKAIEDVFTFFGKV